VSGWTFFESRPASGRFLITATGYGPDGANVDITVVRGAVTQIESYSSGDPFGDAAAVLTFPTITMFDDPTSMEFRRWLYHFADIDIYWAPSVPATPITAPEDRVIDPVTQQPILTNPYGFGAVKVWEGFIASFEFTDQGLSMQCQGALYQLDRYQAKPFYPARPWPVEALIADQFDHTRRPNLRTMPLQIGWPTSWKRTVPAYSGEDPPVFAPVVAVGVNWTQYVSRSTGGWEAALTSFIQGLLTGMITRNGDGDNVPPGDQWTVDKYTGRRPVLHVRDRHRIPDFTVWLGTPGVAVSLSSDSTQAGNIIYGQGQDIHGVAWNNAIISNDGTRTDYQPLAADPAVFPLDSNPLLVQGAFVSEVNAKFDSGISQADATGLAALFLGRDRETGWTGSVTLSVDPSPHLPRWLITSGMTLLLKGFLGSGNVGVRLHISAVEVTPESGDVALTVDTRYRDLLTVQEAINRARDPLTPVKMLQINRTSITVEDIQAPWDYAAGSGYVPRACRQFHVTRPATQLFPYVAFAKARPPKSYPDFYVKCNASAAKDYDKWAGPVPVRVSKSGTINRTEFAIYDANGNVITDCPFHVSFYNLDVSADDMPTAQDGSGPSPFINNAFEKIDPNTGEAWPSGNYLDPPDSLIIGWGNVVNNVANRAGFSPGSEADDNKPTGLLIDAVNWQYDTTKNMEYQPYIPNGLQDDQALLIWAMFYAEYRTPVYFMGRLFHLNSGSE
jgi:hypothetical protein